MVSATRYSESNNRDFNANGTPVVSPKGARYGMQVMPSTAAHPGYGLAPADPNNPQDMNRLGGQYLGKMLDVYHDPAKAWGAYNAGPGNVNRALQYGDSWLQHMPAETRAYVAKNMRNY